MHLLMLSAMLLVAQPAPDLRERERHPLAPSLPLLTKEESAKIEAVIERCILADLGKLKGSEAKKATDDFNRLGPESTFELINGVNKAAELEGNCPVVIIAKKLSSILATSEDAQLLSFARENVGAGVVARRHRNVIQNLQTQCFYRTAAVRRLEAARGRKSVTVMTVAELEKSALQESGPALKAVLTEAERRAGSGAIDVLARGITSSDRDIAALSQSLLMTNLQRQPPALLKALVRHERKEVRLAAAQTIGSRKLRLGAELIVLVTDSDAAVTQAARQALVQLAGGGVDHGPSPAASFGDREESAGRWRTWWERQK